MIYCGAVAKGWAKASTWRDCVIRLALSVPTHIKNAFFSYLPLVKSETLHILYIFIIILLMVTEKI